jgi:hypothetical protein
MDIYHGIGSVVVWLLAIVVAALVYIFLVFAIKEFIANNQTFMKWKIHQVEKMIRELSSETLNYKKLKKLYYYLNDVTLWQCGRCPNYKRQGTGTYEHIGCCLITEKEKMECQTYRWIKFKEKLSIYIAGRSSESNLKKAIAAVKEIV